MGSVRNRFITPVDRSLASPTAVPMVAVDHLEAHLYACQLAHPDRVVYPFLGLRDDHHSFSHNWQGKEFASITRFWVDQYAYLLKKLDSAFSLYTDALRATQSSTEVSRYSTFNRLHLSRLDRGLWT